MVRYRFSLLVEGPDFDPAKFDASLPFGCKGEVRNYRTTRIPWKSYWTSTCALSGDPNATAMESLTSLSNSLMMVMSETTRIAVTIEQLVSDHEEISGGVHLSADLVKLAARFNASIDIPMHPDLTPRTKVMEPQ